MLAAGEETLNPKLIKCKMMVMTSEINHNETVEFFKANNYFGAKAWNFIFFK
jgi:UDP-N-acetylglucosamine pyrophosphorylase